MTAHCIDMNVLIIADDLSGAADCAIGFASTGQKTFVAVQPSGVQALGTDGHLAVDTDTRRLPPMVAAERTAATYAALKSDNHRLYKKIDSTLRGNWASEVANLLPLAGLAIVAPAHPALGRTVKDGHVFLHGEPLERTEIWQLEHGHLNANITTQLEETGLSVATLQVDELIDQPATLAIRLSELAERGIDAIVIGAETTAALRCLASATLSMSRSIFWVGSGGLAREIADLLPTASAGSADAAAPGDAPVRSQGPTLIVAGSLSAVTERQSAQLGRCEGVETIMVPPHILREGSGQEDWGALQALIGDVLDRNVDVLLRIGRDDHFDPSEGAQLCTALARLALPHYVRIGGLIATGGETARALLVEVGVDHLLVLHEVETGVVVGVPSGTSQSRHPWIVTKAGAFGTDEALVNAWQSVRSPRADMRRYLHHPKAPRQP